MLCSRRQAVETSTVSEFKENIAHLPAVLERHCRAG
jgi:hypothetical protein